MVIVGDLDLDEALGPLLDPIGASDIPRRRPDPALAAAGRYSGAGRRGRGHTGRGGAPAPRRRIAQSIDRLAVEGIAPEDLLSEDVLAIIGEQAEHWRQSTRAFLTVQAHWRAQLEAQGEVDPPVRRNMLFDRAAMVWRDNPPPHAVVAAGITSASPSLARFCGWCRNCRAGRWCCPISIWRWMMMCGTNWAMRASRRNWVMRPLAAKTR
jgi:ATP-dependent helicase/nuclease subunit B